MVSNNLNIVSLLRSHNQIKHKGKNATKFGYNLIYQIPFCRYKTAGA